jgi:hypothetical protein
MRLLLFFISLEISRSRTVFGFSPIKPAKRASPHSRTAILIADTTAMLPQGDPWARTR